MKTIEAARGKWFGILRHFGIDESHLKNRHGPCPLCGGKDRFRWDDKDGSGSYFCGQCGAGSGMDLLMKYTDMSFKEVAGAVDGILGNVERQPSKPKPDPRKRLRMISEGLEPMDGTNPVYRYLQGRGLKPAQTTQYHPGLDYYEGGKRAGKYPAMVHLFHSNEGRPLTYHVTYLSGDGKAQVENPRKVMPAVSELKGGAIRLFDCGDSLGIAEGVETAIAANQLFEIPTWAAYSAQLLEQFQPPSHIKRLVIFSDNDVSFTGQKAAYSLAHRVAPRIDVDVLIPERVATDWADAI